jgi:hypothetical protein
MDARAAKTFDGILIELTAISKEIENVANDLRSNRGIGAIYCSNKLIRISSKYINAKDQLLNIK